MADQHRPHRPLVETAFQAEDYARMVLDQVGHPDHSFEPRDFLLAGLVLELAVICEALGSLDSALSTWTDHR